MTILKLIMLHLINGVSLLTISTTPEIKVKFRRNTSLVLSCNYSKEPEEEIQNRNIKWQKEIGNKFVDVAVFSPPGGQEPFIHRDMTTALSKRTNLIAPNISSSATMIINDVVCSDEGLYQCWIEYFVNFGDENRKSSTSVTFEAEATKPVHFDLKEQKNLEENQLIHLNCAADVGNPMGNITIWKVPEETNIPEIVYTSNFTNDKTENCTTFLNVSIKYKVSRNDNGSTFLCSSQNKLTKEPGPGRYSQRISVLYGPGTPNITLSPFKTMYYVGDDLKLECFSDSNPAPEYSWAFQSTNDSEEIQTVHLISNGSSMMLNNLQTNSSGKYFCFADNTFNGKTLNVSSVVSISVKYPDKQITAPVTCNSSPCQIGEVCKEMDGKAVCGFNTWKVISLIFILFTVVLATSTGFLFIKHRTNQQLFDGDNEKSMSLFSSQDKGKDNGNEKSHQDGSELYDVAWT